MVRIRLIATALQVLGLAGIVAGTWLVLGVGVALVVGGVLAVFFGALVERSVASPVRAGDV